MTIRRVSASVVCARLVLCCVCLFAFAGKRNRCPIERCTHTTLLWLKTILRFRPTVIPIWICAMSTPLIAQCKHQMIKIDFSYTSKASFLCVSPICHGPCLPAVAHNPTHTRTHSHSAFTLQRKIIIARGNCRDNKSSYTRRRPRPHTTTLTTPK